MSVTNLDIRKYIEEDYTEFESMVFALYREDSYGESMSKEKISKTVSELTVHPEKGKIAMFCIREKIVGYAIIINFWSNEHGGDIVFIDEIYVKPDWRNQGISSSFINYLSGSENSIQALQVEVTPANEKSLEFFRRQGFKMDENRFLIKIL